jgi:hypothetical protein
MYFILYIKVLLAAGAAFDIRTVLIAVRSGVVCTDDEVKYGDMRIGCNRAQLLGLQPVADGYDSIKL